MPKRRKAKRARYVWDGDVQDAACDRTTWETFWGGAAAGREAWAALRDRYRAHPGDRPGVFWTYCEDVPEALRDNPAPADPRAPGPVYAAARRRELDVEGARLRWLLNGGQDHLRPGETAGIVRRLNELEAEAKTLRGLV